MTDSPNTPLKIGLIVNPVAGMGGRVGLKGTDGQVDEAIKRGAKPIANQLATRALQAVAFKRPVSWLCGVEAYGENALRSVGFMGQVIAHNPELSHGEVTTALAQAMAKAGADLIVFAGGDGTARDIHAANLGQLPVLGIPSGVKMYSGVFARNAVSVGEVLNLIVSGKAVAYREVDVRDLDEAAMRDNKVVTRFFGKLWTILDQQLVQQMKGCSAVSDELIKEEIAAYVAEIAEPGELYLLGSGTTTQAVKEQMSGEQGSLLGFDAIVDGQMVAKDLWEAPMLSLLKKHLDLGHTAKIIITVTGGQGFLLGRGNQQLSPEVIKRVGIDNILVVATEEKIASLSGQPLWVDTRDTQLDAELCGLRPVLINYEAFLLYPVSAG
ncbi:MAG: ATP-NAD kinase family protein [Pseudomonadota bacterium]|nr:ATP-NAD kinase family protein [Pseudomonadota bacterium]